MDKSGVSVIVKANLTKADWELYGETWSKANIPNPFISPQVLQLNTTGTLHIAFIYRLEEIIGAIPFQLRDKTLSVAGEEKSDAINFLFIPSTPTYIKQEAILATFKAINFNSFFSGKLADNRFDYLLVIRALKQLGFKYTAIKTIKNPMVKLGEEYSEESFLKIFSKRNTRNYCNKLRKNFGYDITAIEEFEENKVRKWLEAFFTFHIARWNATDTPSIYSDEKIREELYKKVKAWLNDKVGLLFSVDVNNEPFAMALSLKSGESIIYHQISSTGEETYHKYPKQKILILELAKWMIENSYRNLDFGVGVEPYKYEYANKDPYIMRLYAAKSVTSIQYIKGGLDYYYQNNPKTQKILNGKVRPTITKAKTTANLLKTKLAVNLKEADGNYTAILKKLARKGKPNIEYFYQYIGEPKIVTANNVKLAKVGMLDMLKFYEQEIILTPQKRLHYVNALVEKTKEPWGLYTDDNELAAIAWLAEPTKNDDPPIEGIKNLKVIIDCFTAKKNRGKGYYPILISYLAEQQKNSTVMIYTNDWNIASQKGILKAGFKEVITRKTAGDKHEWLDRK